MAFLLDSETQWDLLKTTCNALGVSVGRWETKHWQADSWFTMTDETAMMQALLEAIKDPLTTLKQQFGYVTEDVVKFSRDLEQYNIIADRFRREHHHADDEVRVVLAGAGVFGFVATEPGTGEASSFEIRVRQGDWLVIPAQTRHYFYIEPNQSIIALRVFKDTLGWEAIY
jgi:1,2-dihydroxy-3-keto-5-methylthiopentene dioxygenase